MQQFRCLQWIFIAHLDQIFFFNPQFTLVNAHISASKTLPFRNWQVRNGLYSAWEKEKFRRFNTITHFTNARSVHSGFYKRKTMDDDQKKFIPQLAIDIKKTTAPLPLTKTYRMGLISDPSLWTVPLKVPSHQIRLCLKCYGWIGLDEYKDRGW